MSDERDKIKLDEGMSEDKIKDVSAQETTRTNELAKYKAAASDRMSTAAISIGFFSPAAAIILNPAPMTGIDCARAILLAFATCNWFVLSRGPVHSEKGIGIVLEYAISSFVICLFVGGGAWIYTLYDVRKSQRRHEEFMRKIETVRKRRAAPAE